MLVDGAIQVMPLGFDRNVSFVDAPRGAHGLGESVPPLLKLRHVARHPSKDRRMGDLDAALGHHLDQIPIRQAIRDVPTYAQLDNVRAEGASAVDCITGDRLRHSTPRKTDRAFYRMSRDAPELAGSGCSRSAARLSQLPTSRFAPSPWRIILRPCEPDPWWTAARILPRARP